MMSFFKRIVSKFFLSRNQILMQDLEMIRLIDIAECGLDSENIPYIRLRSGEIFYSFLTEENKRRLYHTYRATLPPLLTEDCFQVALDIIQRFYRENTRVPPSLPKSHYLYPGWGFIDLGAYLGFGAIKAARKVGTDGKVIAVEASSQAYSLLLKNIEANNLKNVSTVHAVIQNTNELVRFFQGGLQSNSIHKHLVDQIAERSNDYSDYEIVQGKTVDTILQETNYPIKMMNTFVSFEINGAEPLALLGMKNFLQSCPRFDLRIAARYGNSDTDSTAVRIVEILSAHQNITIVEAAPLIYAYRY